MEPLHRQVYEQHLSSGITSQMDSHRMDEVLGKGWSRADDSDGLRGAHLRKLVAAVCLFRRRRQIGDRGGNGGGSAACVRQDAEHCFAFIYFFSFAFIFPPTPPSASRPTLNSHTLPERNKNMAKQTDYLGESKLHKNTLAAVSEFFVALTLAPG